MTLRPYQADIISQYHAQLASGIRRILLVAGTGSGKTVIAAEIIDQAVKSGQRVLFLAHRRELITQASRKLYAVGCSHGILLPGHKPKPDEPVQVASVPTLHARAMRGSAGLPPADLIVVDEAHHILAQTYEQIIQAYPAAAILGLTATPCRNDGQGLGNVFQTMLQCPQVAELIAGGYLVPTVVYASSAPDLRGVATARGDYVQSQLAQRVDNDKSVSEIVQHWLARSERRPTVVFAAGVEHSIHIRDAFRQAGVTAEHVDGSTPVGERDAILARLSNGSVEVVCNAMVLTEGWDQPAISCLVLARPTQSFGLYRQMVGRAMRTAQGKVNAIVLDHAGATAEHGRAEDPIGWSLSGERRMILRRNSTQSAPRRKPATKPMADRKVMDTIQKGHVYRWQKSIWTVNWVSPAGRVFASSNQGEMAQFDLAPFAQLAREVPACMATNPLGS